MKIIYLLLYLLLSSKLLFSQLGNVVIAPQLVYEESNTYFPHDYFVNEDMQEMLDTAVYLKRHSNYVVIENKFNDGYSGHKIRFIISNTLNIDKVDYERWSDVIDGSTRNYTVENVIFSTDKSPFEMEYLTGHYVLQIREDFKAGDLLNNIGINDTVLYSIFKGKFKVYKEQEKQKGRDWIVNKNEVDAGIKDSSGIYFFADRLAEYRFGDDALRILTNEYRVSRKETYLEKKAFVTISFIVDEYGNVDSKSIVVEDKLKTDVLLIKLQKDKYFLENWIPAIHKGRPVKSEVSLPIMIKE